MKFELVPKISLAAALTAVLAAPSVAGWSKTTNQYAPSFPAAQADSCVNPIFGYVLGAANANTWSTGAAAHGDGFAWDVSLGCDVRVQNVATGFYLEAWTYTGEDEGWASTSGTVTATGVVKLLNADCAAAAIGYGQVTSSLFDLCAAKLDESAGETTSTGLGELSLEIEGVGGSVPVTVSTGEGTYPDNDQDADVGQDCVDFVKVKRKSRAQIEMYANSNIDIIGECNGSMDATAAVSVSLGVCPKKSNETSDQSDQTGGGNH